MYFLLATSANLVNEYVYHLRDRKKAAGCKWCKFVGQTNAWKCTSSKLTGNTVGKVIKCSWLGAGIFSQFWGVGRQAH